MSNSAAADPAPDHAGQVGPIIAAHRDRPGAMLPILHAIQRHLGWVPGAAVPLIADALNCSRAEVQGVLDFYHDFRRAPPGRHVLQLCRAESCQALGGLALEAHARAVLGLDYYQTSADGALTLEPVYCLGNCACSPAVRVDDEILGRVDPDRFDALIAGLRGAGVPA
ncbi:formate dehydrogenase subunit gamma [uncultured Thiodictyon sp.]|jgi:formate dehydrogenase subunit gamma|uniref:formate dehydrogenase subunit gamma n=1 Tax=uncultured Thiodictyon sp. TaxID=1846217 RepID=UPI0025EAA892|nr:formate dehydrogenase subunit gamma [uncultured Thiodictyon sp.]